MTAAKQAYWSLGLPKCAPCRTSCRARLHRWQTSVAVGAGGRNVGKRGATGGGFCFLPASRRAFAHGSLGLSRRRRTAVLPRAGPAAKGAYLLPVLAELDLDVQIVSGPLLADTFGDVVSHSQPFRAGVLRDLDQYVNAGPWPSVSVPTVRSTDSKWNPDWSAPSTFLEP